MKDLESYLSGKTVEVTSSSIRGNDKNVSPFHAIDFNIETRFITEDQQNSFICFDFKERKIKLSNYSVRSSIGTKPKSENVQCWKIEGSNDNIKWDTLDSQTIEKSLDGKGFYNTFSANSSGFYRLIRMRQTNANTSKNNVLKIGEIEFFGEILQNSFEEN
ncbi:hypothetical protein M9Y10_009313 [Tritrichomonas musculus]|uniref:F5/8 type C domain-containing protein n=1 Tax=Tritrichomonas musculus TaxID=1915356 RepID=A0ABR2IQH8_9EUKA